MLISVWLLKKLAGVALVAFAVGLYWKAWGGDDMPVSVSTSAFVGSIPPLIIGLWLLS